MVEGRDTSQGLCEQGSKIGFVGVIHMSCGTVSDGLFRGERSCGVECV